MARSDRGGRSRWAMALGAVAAGVLVAGGVAWATIPDASGVIHACYGTDGALRVVDPPSPCRAPEQALSWNQQGPKGDPGTPAEGVEVFTAGASFVVPAGVHRLVVEARGGGGGGGGGLYGGAGGGGGEGGYVKATLPATPGQAYQVAVGAGGAAGAAGGASTLGAAGGAAAVTAGGGGPGQDCFTLAGGGPGGSASVAPPAIGIIGGAGGEGGAVGPACIGPSDGGPGGGTAGFPGAGGAGAASLGTALPGAAGIVVVYLGG